MDWAPTSHRGRRAVLWVKLLQCHRPYRRPNIGRHRAGACGAWARAGIRRTQSGFAEGQVGNSPELGKGDSCHVTDVSLAAHRRNPGAGERSSKQRLRARPIHGASYPEQLRTIVKRHDWAMPPPWGHALRNNASPFELAAPRDWDAGASCGYGAPAGSGPAPSRIQYRCDSALIGGSASPVAARRGPSASGRGNRCMESSPIADLRMRPE
jgi:hypothetical protein